MIQPAVPSVSSNLALAAGMQVGQDGEAGSSADFAALLTSTLAVGPNALAEMPSDAATLQLAAGRQSRQAAGKALPDLLPVKLFGTAPDGELQADQAATDEDSAPDDGLVASGEALGGIVLPGFVVPVAFGIAPLVPGSAPVTRESSLGRTSRTSSTAASLAQSPTDTIRTTAPLAGSEATVARADLPTPLPQPVDARANPDTVSAGASLALPVSALPAATFGKDARTPADGSPAPPIDGTTQQNAASPAGVSRASRTGERATDPHVADGSPAAPPVHGADRPISAALGDASSATRAADLTARAEGASRLPADLGSEKPAAERQPTLGADLQPSIIPNDAKIFAHSATAVTTAPTIDATVQPTAHDFAKLVDRLVEAREATMPQAVSASIAHSDFGQVSLRFEHDRGGLSVSMTSADPDFAQAVQVSSVQASSASADTRGATEDRGGQPRQDATGQQALGQQASGSPSGQPQSQAFTRHDGARPDGRGEPRTSQRPGTSAGDANSAETHGGGIYA